MASAEGKVTVPVKPVPWKEGDRDVPAVLGHDEGQPAYGVAVKTWRDGPKLMADIVNIPKDVADAIKAGAYFQTSAEVYDDTGEAGLPGGGGCMLRRIALLGADIPQVKTLSDLPKPDKTGALRGVEIFATGDHRGIKYRESDLDNMVKNFNRYSAPAVKFAAGQHRHKVAMVPIKKHSEVSMSHKRKTAASVHPEIKSARKFSDRSRIIESLVAGGCDRAALEALDEPTLNALAPAANKLAPGSATPPELMADNSGADNATTPSDQTATDSPEFDRTSIIAQLVGKGLDPNELNALSDDDLKQRLQQVNSIDGVTANDEDDGDGSDSDDPNMQANDEPDDLGVDAQNDETQVVYGGPPDDLGDSDGDKQVTYGGPADDLGVKNQPDQVKYADDADKYDGMHGDPASGGSVAKQGDSTLGNDKAGDDNSTLPGAQTKKIPAAQKLSCGTKKMGDGKLPAVATGASTPNKSQAFSEARLTARKNAEKKVSAMHEQLLAAQKQINETVAQAARDVKKAKFEAFKEVLRSQGRLVPAMEDGGKLDEFVGHLDHSTVRKFGESKKTQFEMFQEILGMIPRVVKFGESVKSSNAGIVKLAEAASDDGVEGVKARFRKHSEKYSRMGFKEEEAVEAFQKRKAKNPLLIASDVLPD